MKEPQPNPIVESKQKLEAENSRLPKVGDTVRVMGVNGEIEDGWTVRLITKKNLVAIEKEIPAGNPRRPNRQIRFKPVKKFMTPAEYQDWNPEPVAESVSESGPEVIAEPDFNSVSINAEAVKDYLLNANDDVRNKFTQRLTALFSLLAADPSMANDPEHYSLKITDAHTGLAVLNSTKEIEIGIDVLLQDEKPMELVARTITEGVHSSFNIEKEENTGGPEDNSPEENAGIDPGVGEEIHEKPAPPRMESYYDFLTPGLHPKAEPIPESVAEEKEKSPTLDEAREAYAKALRKYDEANKGRASSIYGIGGDNSAIAETRAAYDAALKAASKEERERILKEKGYASDERNPNIRAQINRSIVEKFVVDEKRTMAALKVSEMSEQKQSWYKKTWAAYSRLPSKTKIAISTAISMGVGLAAGGGTAYLARRAASPIASATAGFLTNVGFGVYDKTLGKKNTKEYQMSAALEEITGDVSECLDDVRLRHDEILENQADQEKKRMYLKIAIAAIAGASVSGAIAHHFPSGGNVPVHHASGAHAAGAETASKSVAHPANTSPHPTETVPLPKAPEHPVAPPPIEHGVVEVHKGDSLWEITAREVQKDPGFDKLNDAQKTWVISDLVDHAEAHKAALGIANPDHLVIGEKIDLSSILKDGDIHGLMEKAGHLTAAQQEHILANNHAIASWLHAHPHEQLTGARVNEILHGGAAHHGDIPTVRPPDVDNTIPLHHPENFKVMPQHVQVGNIAEQIHRMSPNPEHGQQLLERINGMDQIPPPEMRQLLLIAAERAGDHRPMLIDMNNAMEVRRQMRDYLVSYPRAQEFGFRSYDHWARVRDVPVHRFAEDTTISPRPEVLRSALQHSFFHRGASVHEMQNGALRSVPLEERHANLGMAIRGNSDLVRRAPQTTTVGEFVAEHHGTIRRK